MALRTNKTWFGVVLDAPDARELAYFYQRLLDWDNLRRVGQLGGARSVGGFRLQPRLRH
jgi:hypothetical protein